MESGLTNPILSPTSPDPASSTSLLPTYDEIETENIVQSHVQNLLAKTHETQSGANLCLNCRSKEMSSMEECLSFQSAEEKLRKLSKMSKILSASVVFTIENLVSEALECKSSLNETCHAIKVLK